MKVITENWKLLVLIVALVFTLKWCHENVTTNANASPPVKAKFYDFSEQLIDGEIRRPTALYTDSRQEAKFKRLLRLKRSFDRELHNSARMSVFK